MCIIGKFEVLLQNGLSHSLSDDIYQQSPPKLLYPNVLGGAGVYASLGARMFRGEIVTGSNDCGSVGMIVHEGFDFPADAKAELESWHLSSLFVKTPQRLTTRGKNTYSWEGVRGKHVLRFRRCDATPTVYFIRL